nr:class I SAM-dependent methyltransferase [uncultured Caproiciproducens sp.]
MKNTQNIFDDEDFFEGYRKIRDNPVNYNKLLEQPALMSLLPDLEGKSVLDIGCGAGGACLEYVRRGASQVTGIDLSEKMLALAKIQALHEKIQYERMDMCDIGTLNRRFDIVVSSLAVHYVAEFPTLLSAISDCLNDGGCFLFSQEHPLTTAPCTGPKFTVAENGELLHYNLTDYGRGGIRSTKWMVNGVINYHRTFSEIINALLDADFAIDRMLEPLPDDPTLCLNPNMEKEFYKPSFLVIRCRKSQKQHC